MASIAATAQSRRRSLERAGAPARTCARARARARAKRAARRSLPVPERPRRRRPPAAPAPATAGAAPARARVRSRPTPPAPARRSRRPRTTASRPPRACTLDGAPPRYFGELRALEGGPRLGHRARDCRTRTCRARTRTHARMSEASECPVCLEAIQPRTEPHGATSYLFPCAHRVCMPCNARLLERNDLRCPLCRKPREGVSEGAAARAAEFRALVDRSEDQERRARRDGVVRRQRRRWPRRRRRASAESSSATAGASRSSSSTRRRATLESIDSAAERRCSRVAATGAGR